MQRFTVGEVIDDRYAIIGLLGHGGMAQVYRAHDQHLDRDVALKVLRPHLTEADQERFRREIKALARLSHPGIVSIYDLGRGDHVYFAMELVEGGMFTELGPLQADLEPLITFLEAAISVAEALAYVHRHGMVHRDLTPRNILMTLEGQPKVMDFGLVQLAESSRQLTRTGFTLGTPQYMAPEQARGDPIGPHTDLYALGAVLYRTVTGSAPFDAENDQAVLYQHVYNEVVPPCRRNPAVPRSLSQLIVRLLAKSPEQRPASGDLVADALRAIRHDLEVASTYQRAGGPGNVGLFGGGPIHPSALRRIWSVRLPDGPQWPAALTAAEGFVLLGLKSEEICALRPADGGVQARFAADDEVNSAVVYQQGQLYYSSRAGALYALAWPGGELRYADAQAGVVGGVVPLSDSLLLASSRGWLERRRADGEVLWRYDLGEAAATAPTVYQGLVGVMARDGWFHCCDADSGTGKFKAKLGPVAAQPVIKDGVALLAERSGDLHALDIASHELVWSYDLEGEVWASPVAWRRFVYAVSWAGVVRCLSLKSGDDVWSSTLGARVTASPILASGILYVVTEEGEVIAFDARSGHRLFADRLGSSAIHCSPVVLGDTLIVAAIDGTVAAYR